MYHLYLHILYSFCLYTCPMYIFLVRLLYIHTVKICTFCTAFVCTSGTNTLFLYGFCTYNLPTYPLFVRLLYSQNVFRVYMCTYKSRTIYAHFGFIPHTSAQPKQPYTEGEALSILLQDTHFVYTYKAHLVKGRSPLKPPVGQLLPQQHRYGQGYYYTSYDFLLSNAALIFSSHLLLPDKQEAVITASYLPFLFSLA